MASETNNPAAENGRLLCDFVLEHLASFGERRLYQQEIISLDSFIASHLRSCTTCEALLHEINTSYEATIFDTIPPPEHHLAPDLTFLDTQLPFGPNEAGASSPPPQLSIQFSPALLTAASTRRRAVVRGQSLFRFEQRSTSEQPLLVLIDVLADESNPETVTVIVHVQHARLPPFGQSGTQVIIESTQTMLHGTTDAIGRVVFQHVLRQDITSLRFLIIPPVAA
jgi:hypothetical protein